MKDGNPPDSERAEPPNGSPPPTGARSDSRAAAAAWETEAVRPVRRLRHMLASTGGQGGGATESQAAGAVEPSAGAPGGGAVAPPAGGGAVEPKAGGAVEPSAGTRSGGGSMEPPESGPESAGFLELPPSPSSRGGRPARRFARPGTLLVAVVLAGLVAAAVRTFALPGAIAGPASSPAHPTSVAGGSEVAMLEPSARLDAAMAYDPANGTVLLFGGLVLTRLQGALGDTWSWNGSGWSELLPPASPPALADALLGYDPATGRMVLIGGDTATAQGQLEDSRATWTWNGSTWTPQAAAGLPGSDWPIALATDEADSELILLTDLPGCQGTQTWRWGGSSWVLLQPAASPPPTASDSLAFDPQSGGLDLFPSPGDCSGQTTAATSRLWSWNGTNWSPGTAAAGAVLEDGSWELTTSGGGEMAVTSAGTYLWSGGDAGSWTRLSSSPVLGDAALAYDVADNRAILFGGICAVCGPDAVADTWTFSASWTLRSLG